jgi:hypothetical protein
MMGKPCEQNENYVYASQKDLLALTRRVTELEEQNANRQTKTETGQGSTKSKPVSEDDK